MTQPFPQLCATAKPLNPPTRLQQHRQAHWVLTHAHWESARQEHAMHATHAQQPHNAQDRLLSDAAPAASHTRLHHQMGSQSSNCSTTALQQACLCCCAAGAQPRPAPRQHQEQHQCRGSEQPSKPSKPSKSYPSNWHLYCT